MSLYELELRARCDVTGRARHQDICDLNQVQRSCRVPCSMHPATNGTAHKKIAFNSVLAYFEKQASVMEDLQEENQRLRMRIASSSEDMSDEQSDQQQEDRQPDKAQQIEQDDDEQTTIIPHGICAMVDAMIDQLNDVYANMPDDAKRTKVIIENSYNTLLKSSMWSSKSAQKHFPQARFIQYLDMQFPTGCMRVSADRRKYSCSICTDMLSVEVAHRFHRQNCFKHFRSAQHCANACAQSGVTPALVNGVLHDREMFVYAHQLPQAVIDDAIISSARKSLSLTAVPVMLEVIARALLSCRGKEPLSTKELMEIRKVSGKGATMLSRLLTLVKTEKTSAGTRSVIRRGRTAVTSRLLKLSQQTMKLKLEFFKKCKFMCLTADESDTYSFSAPLAAALCGCTPTFEWANLFVGQTDVVADKTGPGLFASLRKLLNKDGYDLLKKICMSCFDGASTMRSIPLYAGLDGNPTGTSVLACIKRYQSCEKVGNVHGLCHLFNLAQKKTMQLCPLWVPQWQDHIKSVFRWFSKSPSRKSKLKQLHKEMALVNDVVTWRLIYPKYYCPTRWIGIARCLKSILAAGPLLEQYVDSLVRAGFRPVREQEEEEEAPPLEQIDARIDSESDTNSDDDDSNDQREHADTFHVWGTDYWDLPIRDPDAEDVDIASEDERLAMDSRGRASKWDDLEDTFSKKKGCRLLSPRSGLTCQMLGIDAMMLDALMPYKILVERLQTQVVPIGHQVRQWITVMFKQLNEFLGSAPRYGPNYLAWKQRDDVTRDLAAQIESMGRQYVHKFLTDVKYRLRPYWKLILAAETINPCGPARLSPSAWDGVADLCARAKMSVARTHEVIADLKLQHAEAEDWCRAEVRICKTNLLKFYHDRIHDEMRQDLEPRHPHANLFATIIFSIQFVSACIETYFSKTR